jgi:hypothetical protein
MRWRDFLPSRMPAVALSLERIERIGWGEITQQRAS